MLSNLEIAIVRDYGDGDKIVESYRMPVTVDSKNYDTVCEILANHLQAMALELSGVDRLVHPVQ